MAQQWYRPRAGHSVWTSWLGWTWSVFGLRIMSILCLSWFCYSLRGVSDYTGYIIRTGNVSEELATCHCQYTYLFTCLEICMLKPYGVHECLPLRCRRFRRRGGRCGLFEWVFLSCLVKQGVQSLGLHRFLLNTYFSIKMYSKH